KLFQHFPAPVGRLIRDVQPNSFLHHDIYDIKPLSTFVYQRVVLLGDAAHATSPNLGQGAGQAIDDAYWYTHAFGQSKTMEPAFNTYNKKRVNKPRKVIRPSRRLGKAAQWDNPFLLYLRNTVLPLIPEDVLFSRLQ